MRLLAAAALALLLAVAGGARAQSGPARSDTSVFRGLGTWISIFATSAYAKPDATATAIAARGVRTAYVETSNFSQPADVVRPAQLGALVDALHARGVRVVAWYLPGFADLARDGRRARAAIDFRTSSGGTFDGFALDIESTAVKSPTLRTRRALTLSQQLRAYVPDEPLGAIIPSPRGMELKPGYWPGFPYAELAGVYDAFLPMTYWTYSVKGPDAAYGYLARALALLRAATADHPGLLVHLVGGTSYRATLDEEQAFAELVADDGRLAGWSLYDWFGTTPAAWRALASIPQPVS